MYMKSPRPSGVQIRFYQNINVYWAFTQSEVEGEIYAKEYKLYLPDKKLLQKKLKEWLDEEQN